MSFRKRQVKPNIQNSKRLNPCEAIEKLEGSVSADVNEVEKTSSKLHTVIPTTPYIITLQQAEEICSTTHVADINQLSQEALETEQSFNSLPADVLTNEVKSLIAMEMPVFDASEKKIQIEKNEKLLKKRTKIVPNVFLRSKNQDDTNVSNNKNIIKPENSLKKNNSFQVEIPVLDATEKKIQTSENEKLLKKRTKILPKVSSNRKVVDDSSTLNNEEINETELVKTKSNSFQKSLENNVLTAVSNDKVSANEDVYIDVNVPVLDVPEKKIQTSENEKLLKKRTKILPKVSSNRKVIDDSSTLNNEEINDSFQKNSEKLTSTAVSTDKVSDLLSNKYDNIDLLSNKEVDRTENDLINTSFQKSTKKDKLVAVSDINSMNNIESFDVDLPSMYVPEKKKHVRFNHQTDFEDKATEVVETQKEKLKDLKDINNDIHSDYSSQSDGEVSSKVTVSGKKVFRPNFELQRRKKRLSSFSAYSSCDEAEEEVQKKKKKKQKNSIELIGEKSADNTDRKDGDEKKQVLKAKRKIKTKEKKNLIPAPTKEEKKKVENFSIERNLSVLTMQELISYRPKSFKKVELKAKSSLEEGRVIETANNIPLEESEYLVDDETDVIAPQIMVNEDGEIVINQDSLTIKKKVDNSLLNKSAILYEDSLSYHSGRKKRKVKHWGMEETLRFYKALSEIGTDFTLMAQAFGRFTRNELKKKFKQEEKINCDLIDRALLNRLPLDMKTFLAGRKERKMFEEAEKKEENLATVNLATVNQDELFVSSQLMLLQAPENV